MGEMIKDKIIGVKNFKRGKNSKGNDRFELFIDPEQAIELAELIIEKAQNPRGVKLDMHTAVRLNNNNNREFETAFFFVKEIQESSFNRGGGQMAAPKTYKDKQASKEDVQQKLEAFKSKQLKGKE